MEEQDIQQPEIRPDEAVTVEELIPAAAEDAAAPLAHAGLRAVIEAIVYVAEEPLSVAQLACALGEPAEKIQPLLAQIAAEFEKPEHGVAIREVAGGYKMATKPEHHEAVRAFAKSLKPPLKLSLAALETLAVIAYKQPVTVPEIQEIRGVQGAGVVKTLLDRKLVVMAGRKNVVGKPVLYKTTKEFLIQFGLKDLSELPSLKEFEEIRRLALADAEPPLPEGGAPTVEPTAALNETPSEPRPEEAVEPDGEPEPTTPNETPDPKPQAAAEPAGEPEPTTPNETPDPKPQAAAEPAAEPEPTPEES